MKVSTIVFIVISTKVVVACAQAEPKVEYPDNFRDWYHVKSMVILSDHALADPFEGIHHIYANNTALEGYKTGQFADGSVIVFDLFNSNEGGGALQEGARKLTGVMVKDSKNYSATGGWGFEGFAGDSTDQRLVSDGGAGCFACHEPAKDSGYVFSKLR